MHLHTVEVVGSNPITPIKDQSSDWFLLFLGAGMCVQVLECEGGSRDEIWKMFSKGIGPHLRKIAYQEKLKLLGINTL
jgi:hypothetical protein